MSRERPTAHRRKHIRTNGGRGPRRDRGGHRVGLGRSLGALALLSVMVALVAWGWDVRSQAPWGLDGAVPALSWPFGQRVVVDGVRINPAASIDLDHTYKITLWDDPIRLPRGAGRYEEALREAIAAFQVEFPNVEVAVHLWDQAVLRDADGRAASDGDSLGGADAATLPDIVGGSLSYPIDPERQVPVEEYLGDVAREQFRPGSLASVSDDEHVWGWASWFEWTAGAAKPRRAVPRNGEPDGSRAKPYLDFVGDQLWSGVVQWAWEHSSAPADIGVRVDELLAHWADRGLVPVERRVDAMEQSLARSSRTRLTRFVRAGRSRDAITAPVTPLIARSLVAEDVALLPFPALRPGVGVGNDAEGVGYVPLQPVGYAVLVQKPFQGSEHIRVAMALAQHLSEVMGEWLSARAPYLAARKVDGGIIPDEWKRLLTGSLEAYPPHFLSREAYSARDDLANALQAQAVPLLSGARSAQDALASSLPADGVQW